MSSDDEKPLKNQRNQKRIRDDSEEEYEEDEYEIKQSKRRKGIQNYIFDEAAVDDDEEEDEDYDYDNNNDEIFDQPEEVAEAQDVMDYAKYHNRERQNSFNLDNEEEIEEHYRRRYENNEDNEFGSGHAMSATITQQSCLPGVKDASIWQIRCRLGEEKSTVLKLMQKFITLRRKNKLLDILSVFSKDCVKGYIYIEAYKETHVTIAAENISSISGSISNIKMISIPEMTEVMKVVKNIRKLEVGQYIRLNKGIYRGDLAKVISIKDEQNSVGLQLLPRIDYKKLSYENQKIVKQKFFAKPPAALFNRKKIIELGLDIKREGKYYVFKKNFYDEQGFLYKDFNLSFVEVQGVVPEIHELEKFNEDINDEDVAKQVKKGLEKRDQTFSIGDNVLVVSGSLINAHGKVVSIDNNSIVFHSAELNENLTIENDALRKMFKVGDHVRVLNGQYAGDTGIIVHSSGNSVVVLSDNNINQFKVKQMDLLSSRSALAELPTNHKYLIGDLIQIDPKTVGVITQLQKSTMKALTNLNKEVTLDLNLSFSKKINNKSSTFDNQQQEIHTKDMVDIVSGIYAGKSGEIRYLWKGFVFIYNNNFVENRGLIATKGNLVSRRGISITSKSTNNFSISVEQSPRIHSKVESQKSDFKSNFALKNEKKFVGCTIRIIKGPLKGKVGIIKDLKSDAATIELHSEFKIVSVSKENFKLVDTNGELIDSTFGTLNVRNSFRESGRKTPSYGLKTPKYGSQTPGHGSETPFYHRMSEGGRTPHMGISQTPRVGYSGNAFDPTAATPVHRFDENENCLNPSFMHKDDESDHEYGKWDQQCKDSSPQSPDHIYQDSSKNLSNAYIPDSPPYINYGNIMTLPRQYFFENAEVLVSLSENNIQKAYFQGERHGKVSVKLAEINQVIYVDKNSVFRKEPESGNDIVYFDPIDNSKKYGKCFTIEDGEVVVKLRDETMKMLPIKDVIPYKRH